MRVKLILLKIIKHFCSKTRWKIRTKINKYYHKSISNYIRKYCQEASNNILNIKNTHNSKIIWMFWWQGYNRMPSIVYSCIKSVKKHSGKHKVVLITKYNVKRYVTIPKFIFKKLYDGIISLTHFSDILRFNLLTNYGGLWLDSTIYCTSMINNNYFKSFYTSGGYGNPFDQFVSSKWTIFLIGGNSFNSIFQFMNEFYELYWSNNSYQIDYFLTDYALLYVYENNIGNFKNYVDSIACKNNPHLYDLAKLLNRDYTKSKLKDITYDTNMFKLTYKKEFSNNDNTFYSMVLDDKI